MYKLLMQLLTAFREFLADMTERLTAEEVVDHIPTTWINTLHGIQSLRSKLKSIDYDISDAEIYKHLRELEVAGYIELRYHKILNPRPGKFAHHQQCRRIGSHRHYIHDAVPAPG